jgi:hypothetical protein
MLIARIALAINGPKPAAGLPPRDPAEGPCRGSQRTAKGMCPLVTEPIGWMPRCNAFSVGKVAWMLHFSPVTAAAVGTKPHSKAKKGD